MNISSVSSAANSSAAVSGNYNEIKQLEKEKANLQKELQQENLSKDDTKTKEAKTKQIQMEIQQIDARIQQMKAQKTEQKQNTDSENTADALKGLMSAKENRITKAGQDKEKELLKDPVLGNNVDVQV